MGLRGLSVVLCLGWFRQVMRLSQLSQLRLLLRGFEGADTLDGTQKRMNGVNEDFRVLGAIHKK